MDAVGEYSLLIGSKLRHHHHVKVLSLFPGRTGNEPVALAW